MDVIQFYIDNQGVINIVIGIILAMLLSKVAIKEFVKRIHTLVECIDVSLEDDKITLEEQKQIVTQIKDLLGEGFLTMISKIFTK